MAKKMVIPRREKEDIPLEVFKYAKDNFSFADIGDNELSYVQPYVIATDGKDILINENKDGALELGWRFDVEKGKGTFEDIVENSIFKGFFGLWKSIEVSKTGPQEVCYKNGRAQKKGAEYAALKRSDLSIHATERGAFSVTKRKYCPIYFLIVSNNYAINFINHTDKKQNCVPFSLSWIATQHSSIPLSYMSQKIIKMIRSGEIIMPIISESQKPFEAL